MDSVGRAVGLKAFWGCGSFEAVAWTIIGLELIYAII